MVLVFRDVSAKRRAELERSRLAALVESSEDAIISQTFAGVATDWNAGAKRMYGDAAETVVGKPLAATIVPHDRLEELLQVLQQVKQGQSVESFETVRQCPDGQRLAVSMRNISGTTSRNFMWPRMSFRTF